MVCLVCVVCVWSNGKAYMMYETGTFEEGVDLDETLELYFSTSVNLKL